MKYLKLLALLVPLSAMYAVVLPGPWWVGFVGAMIGLPLWWVLVWRVLGPAIWWCIKDFV